MSPIPEKGIEPKPDGFGPPPEAREANDEHSNYKRQSQSQMWSVGVARPYIKTGSAVRHDRSEFVVLPRDLWYITSGGLLQYSKGTSGQLTPSQGFPTAPVLGWILLALYPFSLRPFFSLASVGG